jgi:hypothetical protein
VAVAVSAFVASSVLQESQQEHILKIQNATEKWEQTYDSVTDRNLVLEAETVPSDSDGAKRRLNRKLGFVKELDGAITNLIVASDMEETLISASIDMLKKYGQIIEHAPDSKSVDQIVAFENEATALFRDEKRLGVLLNSYALDQEKDLEKRASYIRPIRYTLGILAIIVAGIAQIAG